MRRSLSLLLPLLAVAPSAAHAQELIIAVDGPLEEPVAMIAPETPPPSPPLETQPTEDEEDIAGYSGVGLWADFATLSGLSLTLGEPEIEAVRGVRLEPDWAGNATLTEQGLGGAGLLVGMRALRFLRGPELRIWVGGGDVNGPWAPAPGLEGIELSIRSIIAVRFEAAIGVQVPVGPVVPYLLGRAAVGAAFVDVGVRDARLGGLGTERAESTTLELGLEAGLAFRFGEGGELALGVRGSFVGAQSIGGLLTIGFDGSRDAE